MNTPAEEDQDSQRHPSPDLAKRIARLKTDPQAPEAPEVQKAIALARELMERANELQTPQERRQQMELDRMMQHPEDKTTLMQITDQTFRSDRAIRAADQLVHILDIQGVPRFFSLMDRTMLRGFQSFGSYLPGVAVPLVKEKMREETANVIIPAEEGILENHLRQRRNEGVRMNTNFLGEALLGEEEARHRLDKYLAALQKPELEVLSVKISTLYSQIWPIAREYTIRQICDRMELLYRASAKEHFTHADGRETPKFVYLDMEEYRDMSITEEVFIRTLERPGLENVNAGIALQAYLPDSFLAQKRINAWARERVAAGAGAITIRLVKGANLEMERVEASLCDWPQAPFMSKAEVDASYKRMVHEGLKAENIAAVRLGIATHNLFDLAYALVCATEAQALDRIQFEMLEGMANHQRRALFETCHSLLLYAPATRKEDFIHAIGYLIRRLDENTGDENFLRHTFKLEVDSEDWHCLEEGFRHSFQLIDGLSDAPRRTQDRATPPAPPENPHGLEFVNEPHTDFALPENSEWAAGLVAEWQERHGESAADVPLEIAGESLFDDREVRNSTDPSRPGTIIALVRMATPEDIDRTVDCAVADPAGWRTTSALERRGILRKVAQEIREARGALLGIAMAEGGKTLPESDPELSEAVDFVEFYAQSAEDLSALPGIEAKPAGVVAVIPPWNFPIAIPCGGIAAGLAAGNTVIMKPSRETPMIAHRLVECFYRGGIPREALQFVATPDRKVGSRLIENPGVDLVILTGGTQTAFNMLRVRPDLQLLAETGGKNATIVMAMSDRELAIKQVLQSAFGHSGQKCSATSLLILEEEVYEDPRFKRALIDGAASLAVGSAWKLRTRINPLIRPPSGDLEKAIKELEPGESWALMPQKVDDNPCLFSPGIKWGVTPGSYTHRTEFFGPVLAVLKARDLEHAIEIANDTPYGLTSGLQSLDDREQEIWRSRIVAGNLYINRGTTGAIVLRQPFGGMKLSAFGPGIKAGGPNYLVPLMDFSQVAPPETARDISSPALAALRERILDAGKETVGLPAEDCIRTAEAIANFDLRMDQEFGREHDHFKLLGEDNLRRYLPVQDLRIRVEGDDSVYEICTRIAAALAAGCRITVSHAPGIHTATLDQLIRLTEEWGAGIEFVEETGEELARAIRGHQTGRVRYAARDRVPLAIFEAARDTGVYLATARVLSEGRIELLWYLREQSICNDYHRYGNLGDRAGEKRLPVS
jgi:RHH-type proline utilization regulon transcriptional repressor/proline dehydrogenase/delta 1-pyrroline-5-carboxylate dehydrogenase